MEQSNYDIYNDFILKSDTDRLRKIVVRNNLFMKTIELPGDIVELGVFKGVGVITWLKLLEIYSPGNIKKVIGFDFFTKTPVFSNEFDTKVMEKHAKSANYDGCSIEQLQNTIKKLNLSQEKTNFIEGDICETVGNFVTNNPGFKISLLHCDLDVGKPTYEALTHLWDKVVKGGVIIFDEYACSNWSESSGVDKFFKDKDVVISNFYYNKYPTAYVIKK